MVAVRGIAKHGPMESMIAAEEQGEFGEDPAGEFVETAGEGDRQHAENRQDRLRRR